MPDLQDVTEHAMAAPGSEGGLTDAPEDLDDRRCGARAARR